MAFTVSKIGPSGSLLIFMISLNEAASLTGAELPSRMYSTDLIPAPSETFPFKIIEFLTKEGDSAASRLIEGEEISERISIKGEV